MEGRFYLGFLPWVVFDVITRTGGLDIVWGAGSALAATACISLWRHRLTVLELLAYVLFSVTLVTASLGVLPQSMVMYGRTWSAAVLGSFALISAFTIPFAQQYTRELVPHTIERSASFRRVNIALSVTWSVVFCLAAASHAVGTTLDGPISMTLFHWLVPIALAIAGCYTSRRIWNVNVDETTTSAFEVLTRMTRERETITTGRVDAHRGLKLLREQGPKV